MGGGKKRKGLSRVNGGTMSKAHIFSSFKILNWVHELNSICGTSKDYLIITLLCEILGFKKFHPFFDLFLNKLIPNLNFLTFFINCLCFDSFKIKELMDLNLIINSVDFSAFMGKALTIPDSDFKQGIKYKTCS